MLARRACLSVNREVDMRDRVELESRSNLSKQVQTPQAPIVLRRPAKSLLSSKFPQLTTTQRVPKATAKSRIVSFFPVAVGPVCDTKNDTYHNHGQVTNYDI